MKLARHVRHRKFYRPKFDKDHQHKPLKVQLILSLNKK